jgi:hypothetical protein
VLGGPDERVVAGQQIDVRREERRQPRRRRGSGAQGRPPAEQSLLQLALRLVEQGHREARPAAEAVEDRPLAHPGRAGDGVHGHRLDAVALEQLDGGAEDLLAVSQRVSAELDHGQDVMLASSQQVDHGQDTEIP